VAKLLQEVQHSAVRSSVRDLVGQNAEAALEGFTMAAGGLSIEVRQAILKKLVEELGQAWAKEGSKQQVLTTEGSKQSNPFW